MFNDTPAQKQIGYWVSEEREREMFYLTTHSTHFILRLYGVRDMVKDHSDSERARKEGFKVLFNDALTQHILFYGYMASDIW